MSDKPGGYLGQAALDLLARGVMEYWSIGVLCFLGIASRLRGAPSAPRRTSHVAPGLKPCASPYNRSPVVHFASEVAPNAAIIDY